MKTSFCYFQLSKPITLNATHANNILFNEVYTDEGFTPEGTIMGWGATVVINFLLISKKKTWY